MRLVFSVKFFLALVAAVFFTTVASAGEPAKKGESVDAQMRLVGFCTSCHGSNGASLGETIPSIGGQTKDYLVISMTEIKDKARRSTLMQKIAQGYNADEIVAIADYFSKIKWQSSANKLDKKSVAQGKVVSAKCVDCHDTGMGSAETPRIAGQHAAYLYNALIEYKKGLRNNNAGGASMAVVEEISDGDLKAVADYYSSVK